MSDSSIAKQVGENIQDLGKDAGKKAVSTLSSFGKVTVAQIKGVSDNPEQEEEKKRQKVATFQRVKQIEAEMRQIASKNQQKIGPEIAQTDKNNSTELQTKNKELTIDEASRQAIGRAEQGRNFKG